MPSTADRGRDPESAPTAAGSFADLGVPEALAEALAASGLQAPFPIQAAILPDALAGRDVLGRAVTGSGKTVAFAVPLVAAVASSDQRRRPGRPGGLVLVPTRELAAQVSRTLAPIAAAVGLRCATVYGGVPQAAQTAALRRGADVVVATPGRLEDLMRQGHCRLDQVCVTAVDEADLMAELGFLPALRRLLDATPAGGQRLLFSATLDATVSDLAGRYLHHAVSHSIDPIAASPARVDHHLFTVALAHKASVVAELASGAQRSLLFTRTRHGARKLARQLSAAGIPALELHADLTQRNRERNLAAFAAGDVGVLVATDIAARGIHVDDIGLVVHVDPPAEHKSYVHRSGRTARAGAAGKVVTVATPEQTRAVAAMLRKAKVRPQSGPVAPGDMRIRLVAGAPASHHRSHPRTSPTASGAATATDGRGGRSQPPRRHRRTAPKRTASKRTAPKLRGERRS